MFGATRSSKPRDITSCLTSGSKASLGTVWHGSFKAGTSTSTGGDSNSVDISVTGSCGKAAAVGTGIDAAGDTVGRGGGGGGGGVEGKSTANATGSVTGATAGGGGGSVAAVAGGGFAVTLSKCFLKWIFPNSTFGFGGEDSSAEPAASPRSILLLGLKSV